MDNSKQIKQLAVKLRKIGKSYNEIRKEVKVSKSTLSRWLKNVPLKEEYRNHLYTKRILNLSLGSASQKERRAREVEKILEMAKNEVTLPIDFETYRFMGAALYWAEGSKGKDLQITNSDPYLILFIVKWFEAVFGVPINNLRMRLNIYPQQNENKVKKFWSDLTGIPLGNFRKTYIKPMSTGYKKNNLYYGTARIEVPKSVDMHYRLFAWIQTVLSEIDPKIKLVERKWKSLKKISRPVNLK